ncbi:glycosyltransferase [Haliea sp. E17]|uniref:glycosyltransferase n=1 Tax=Haliea sp. E17 TaxID=3401576 RepID=UPI003AAEF814
MSSDIRVAQVMAGAEHGGAESFYTRLVAGFEQVAGIDQVAFTRDYPARSAQLRAAGVDLRSFRFGGRLDVLDHWRYRRALQASAPDVVLTWMNRASILTPRGDYRLACRLGHYYDLKYYRHADFWIGNTQGICDHLVRGGMPAARVQCIPNFVDETLRAPVPRSELGVAEGVPLLLAAGRLHRNKGFDVLLDALAQVPDAVLCLAGVGPEDAALREQAGALGIGERVRFLGWRDDVGALMHSADLFVCSSRHEGLGNIILEAWFRQCPVVATRSQGPEELIDDGQSGLLTPIDDAPALAAAIRQSLADPAAARTMAGSGARCYREQFAESVILARYAELFRKLAAERRG